MMSGDKDVETYFEGKPDSYEVFRVVHDRIRALGPSEIDVRSQISFGVNRKFAWFWLYNVSNKNPSGILHLMLALDRKVDDHRIRDISPIGRSRWNHQIVIRTLDEAESDWLGDMLKLGYAYGSK